MYNPLITELAILKLWKEKKIYLKIKSKNKKNKLFYFLQGPPYTSGRIHIAHAWNNSAKDIILRFLRMQGFNVWDRAGYDMHGLPTENAVQKNLGLFDKAAIEKYGVNKFIRNCIEFSTKRAKDMDKDFLRLGVWFDYENAYYPIKTEFMEGEWWLIKKAHEQKRLYKGKKVMHWCASCETALAKHELEYENIKDKSIFVKFRIKNKDKGKNKIKKRNKEKDKHNNNEFLIIWTTTPWTIPYNLAVMVNPELDYVKVEVQERGKKEIWVLAKALVNIVLTSVFEKKYKIIQKFKGKKLLGTEYEHPLHDEIKSVFEQLKRKHKNTHTVVLSEQYVTTDAGTGLVHCAPGCGPEDYEVGLEYNIPAFNTLDEKGKLENIGKISGFIAKKDDEKIVELLKNKHTLLAQTDVEHEYPFCWRCHNPVIFRATEQWFLKIEDLIDKILKENEKINWVPKWGKTAFNSWVKSLRDNSITRQRYWGTPVPIWECQNAKCKNIEVIGSLSELKKKSLTKIPQDLHKPWIDNVKLRCSKCKKEMIRIPDVIDVWIDSGTTSWNCLYYPSKKEYFNKLFPADLILEATEQVRLWFSMLQICSMIAFKKSSYKNAYMHGMILDWKGMKMSKSLGNVVSPYEIIDKYGADLLRYYMCGTKAGENINFNWEELKQKQRHINVLWNVKNYLIELSRLYKINPLKIKPTLSIEEKYILSKCHNTIKEVTNLFQNYKIDETIEKIESLWLELSRTYIQLTRNKTSQTANKKEKEQAIYTMYNTLINTIKLFAPIAPFVTESIYQELKQEFKLKEESIHLCDWPKANEKLIHKELEQEIKFALEIIEKALAIRSETKIGIRWPLPKITIKSAKKIDKRIQDIIKNQINVKKLEIKKPKPSKKQEEKIIILDTKLTPKLEEEGFVREIIRIIQQSRKKASLKKEQSINLALDLDNKLKNSIKAQKAEKLIKEKTGVKKLELNPKIKKQYSNNFEEKIKGKRINLSFSVI